MSLYCWTWCTLFNIKGWIVSKACKYDTGNALQKFKSKSLLNPLTLRNWKKLTFFFLIGYVIKKDRRSCSTIRINKAAQYWRVSLLIISLPVVFFFKLIICGIILFYVADFYYILFIFILKPPLQFIFDLFFCCFLVNIECYDWSKVYFNFFFFVGTVIFKFWFIETESQRVNEDRKTKIPFHLKKLRLCKTLNLHSVYCSKFKKK